MSSLTGMRQTQLVDFVIDGNSIELLSANSYNFKASAPAFNHEKAKSIGILGYDYNSEKCIVTLKVLKGSASSQYLYNLYNKQTVEKEGFIVQAAYHETYINGLTNEKNISSRYFKGGVIIQAPDNSQGTDGNTEYEFETFDILFFSFTQPIIT